MSAAEILSALDRIHGTVSVIGSMNADYTVTAQRSFCPQKNSTHLVQIRCRGTIRMNNDNRTSIGRRGMREHQDQRGNAPAQNLHQSLPGSTFFIHTRSKGVTMKRLILSCGT